MYPSTGNTKNSDTHHKPSAGMGTMHDKRFKKLGHNIQNLKNRFNRSEPLWSSPRCRLEPQITTDILTMCVAQKTFTLILVSRSWNKTSQITLPSLYGPTK